MCFRACSGRNEGNEKLGIRAEISDLQDVAPQSMALARHYAMKFVLVAAIANLVNLG
jgi:hypothetical protein